MTEPCRAAGEEGAPLSWSRTVERESVHRTSVAEVLLTDVRAAREPHAFEAAATWSRSHVTFPRDGSDLHSPLVLVETLRQLGIYIPARFYAVPPASHSVITDLRFHLDPAGEPRAAAGTTEVTCHIAVSGVREGADGELSALRLAVRFLAGGRVFARAGGGARFLSARRYAVLRAGRSPMNAAGSTAPGGERPGPWRLSVQSAGDVLLARRGGALLVEPADPGHPFFFDHPTDHMPGMVLLEAARQATAVESGGRLMRPYSGGMVAARFTEFGPAPRVVCVPHYKACVYRVLQYGSWTTCGAFHYR